MSASSRLPAPAKYTVFGQPDIQVKEHKNSTWTAELRGVDIFDPITGEVHHTRGEGVAAWFLDTDYEWHDVPHWPGILPWRFGCLGKAPTGA
jgi:hypothetical protein